MFNFRRGFSDGIFSECLLPGDAGKIYVKDGKVFVTVSDPGLPKKTIAEACVFSGVQGYETNLAGIKQGSVIADEYLASLSAPKNAAAELVVSKDSLSADLTVSPPTLGGTFPSLSELNSLCSQKGVVYGIKQDLLAQISEEGICGNAMTIAEGQPAVNGANASVEVFVKMETRAPKEDESGNVDLRDMGAITRITPGQVLAVKTPPTEGQDGKSVRGIDLRAKNGKDISFPGGPGTAVSEDGLQLLSAIEGCLSIINGKIHVLNIFTVEGDVDYSVGNIDFSGGVIVNGAVRDGFTVQAVGDVSINGVVEGALVRSSSNIIVSGGIRGTNKGKLEAEGDITIGFADQATLRSGKNMNIKNALLHSKVECGGTLTVLGGQKSQITGGKIQAEKEVVCLTLGSEAETKTEVTVGVSASKNERRKNLQLEIESEKDALTKIETNIAFLKKLESEGKLTPEKRDLLLKLTKSMYQIKGSLTAKTAEEEMLTAELEMSKVSCSVRVKGTCYPGVTIIIRGQNYVVRDKMKFCSFVYEKGDIKVRPF